MILSGNISSMSRIFLEMTKEVNRRGYLNYKRENADVMVRHSIMCSAICDLLSFLNIGYGKREKAVKPLEKLDVISDKNKKQLNDFIIWLTDNNDYSSHTVYIYYTSMKKYFEYANEVNMDNCRRFIKSLEEEKIISRYHPFANYSNRKIFQMAEEAYRTEASQNKAQA